MLVPLSWLREYLDLKISNDEISSALTLAGLEVDKVESLTFPFTHVVVGLIQDVKPHPNSDHLSIALVFDGTDTHQVVCGAANCAKGMKTALAKIGATLTDDEGKIFKIKKGKLRDIESFGMLCSEKELGLSDSSDGIMTISPNAQVGMDIAELFGDTIFEISLTPNLGHCLSLIGIARELAAILEQKVHYPKFTLNENSDSSAFNAVTIHLEDPQNCPHYSCRLLRNVKACPTPNWLKMRLEACGVRSVNAIVDVTNYVMLELGQPLHAFDYDKISGKKIAIHTTQKEMPFLALDNITHTLPPQTLVISDAEKPIAIAGIMGGIQTEVDDQTSHVLLEAAHFFPSSIRKTSKQLGLRSESSARFERGIDPQGVTLALNRASFLIQEITGCEISKGIIDIEPTPYQPRILKCRLERVNQILGTSLSLNEVESFLKRLEMSVSLSDETMLLVTVPSYRNDIHIEIDLVEEIARIYGYNNIAPKESKVINSTIPHSPIFLIEKQIRKRLISENLQEFITSDLISPKLSLLSEEKSQRENNEIHVLHPSSIDQSVLRTSLLPGLLQAVRHNIDHQNVNINCFEIGRIHFKSEDQLIERATVGILITGKKTPHNWRKKGENGDFFDLKGIIENLLRSLNLPKYNFLPSHLETFHPRKQASIHFEDSLAGVLGEVHPSKLLMLDIKQPVFFAQIDLLDLLEKIKVDHKMIPLALYPSSSRDWTVTLKEGIPFTTITEAIASAKSPLLKEVELLDIYENEKFTLRFVYRDEFQTVEQAQVEKEHGRIIGIITKKIEDV